jgi:hypothetical protein
MKSRAAAIAAAIALVGSTLAGSTFAARPQDEAVARGPRPYTDKEVSFANERAHVKLAGTFSVPNGRGPFPAVLLIAAAGRENRDEVAGGHKVFVVLADYLLRRGIAVLRYDKRGVGASSGDFDNAAFSDLLEDAASAFRYLRTRPEIDSRHLGVIGHSEGGSLAPAVASVEKGVAFVVAMAGSGLNGQFRTINALGLQAQESGAPPEQVENIRALARRIFESVAAAHEDKTANARIAALIDKSVAAQELTSSQAASIRRILSVRSVREALADEPLTYLKKVRVPVLALVGSLDLIIPARPYVEAMQPVLASIPGSHLEVLPQLNHVFQTAKTGSPREFGTIEETISPVALEKIGDWVELQVKVRR